MGIDQIGKKAPPVPPPKPDEARGGRPLETGRPFELTGAGVSSPPTRTEALESPHPALERLRAGDVDVNGYLDLKVNEATAHLTALPTPELEAIRNALRQRMATDPTLVDLVRMATGRTPEPPGGG